MLQINKLQIIYIYIYISLGTLFFPVCISVLLRLRSSCVLLKRHRLHVVQPKMICSVSTLCIPCLCSVNKPYVNCSGTRVRVIYSQEETGDCMDAMPLWYTCVQIMLSELDVAVVYDAAPMKLPGCLDLPCIKNNLFVFCRGHTHTHAHTHAGAYVLFLYFSFSVSLSVFVF